MQTRTVSITYYTQNSNSGVDLDMANSHDGGAGFPASRTVRVSSTAFDLPPSIVPLTNTPSFNATNFDRQIELPRDAGLTDRKHQLPIADIHQHSLIHFVEVADGVMPLLFATRRTAEWRDAGHFGASG